jgi:hypothetical protein
MRALFTATDIPRPPELVAGHRALILTMTEAEQFYAPRTNLTPGYVEIVIDENVPANQADAVGMVHSLSLGVTDVRGLGQYYYDFASATIFRRGGWQPRPYPETLTADVAVTFKALRTLLAIYTDLQALTAAQKTNVWTDLSSGTPKKYLQDVGRNAAAIAALDWAATDSGATGTALTAAKLRIGAMYVQDNPAYLINPSFDPTINVPGIA